MSRPTRREKDTQYRRNIANARALADVAVAASPTGLGYISDDVRQAQAAVLERVIHPDTELLASARKKLIEELEKEMGKTPPDPTASTQQPSAEAMVSNWLEKFAIARAAKANIGHGQALTRHTR